MGKNRIKNLRDITVNGLDYKWLVESTEHGNKLKIWLDKNTLLHEAYLHEESITSGTVAEIIDEINRATIG